MSGFATIVSRSLVHSPLPLPALRPPKRRPVHQMLSLIEAHSKGEQWTVQFRSPIFGVYSVFGPIHRSAVTNELRVGLAFITTGGKSPNSRVLNIWAERADLIDVASTNCSPATVRHGAVVRAEVSSFGDRLTLVGHAVAQRRTELIGVGHHTIRTPSGAAPNLISVSDVAIPSKRPPPLPYAWSDLDYDASRQ